MSYPARAEGLVNKINTNKYTLWINQNSALHNPYGVDMPSTIILESSPVFLWFFFFFCLFYLFIYFGWTMYHWEIVHACAERHTDLLPSDMKGPCKSIFWYSNRQDSFRTNLLWFFFVFWKKKNKKKNKTSSYISPSPVSYFFLYSFPLSLLHSSHNHQRFREESSPFGLLPDF